MPKKKTVRFEASASLQRLIGRELIPNDEMAVIELVKNAYDSRARRAHILIQPASERIPGLIRISDDGTGMSESDVTNFFMLAGYSKRVDEVKSAARVPTGEKGIGRFAADKLGQVLNVYTKKPKSAETLHLTIDWKDFDNRLKKFNEVEATYEIGPSPRFLTAQSGTILEISELRSQWSANQLEAVRTGLGDLLSPYVRPKDFSIILGVGGKRGEVVEHEIEPSIPPADLVMEVAVVGDKVHRVISRRGEKQPLSDEPVGTPADLAYLKGLRAHFLHFDKRPNKKQTRGLVPGVRVYRDGFRIEPFGSRAADWLHIAEQRAKRAGHAHVVPSRLYGFVEISRVKNPGLADTTSRQALLDSPTVRNLVTVLREQLVALDDTLKSIAQPRWEESRRRRAIEAEQARLHTLGVMSYGLAHELRQPLQSIRSEAENIQTKLRLLGVDDVDINAAQASIDRGVERIDKNISFVSDIAKGSVTDLIDCDLATYVAKEVALLAPRAEAVGIKIRVLVPAKQLATINQFAVSTVLINYFRNAIDSLEVANRRGTVLVTVKRKSGRNYLEVEDDGDGVEVKVQAQIFKKFSTQKTGGMGLGLYYCKSIVESHGGSVGFESTPGKGARFWMLLPDG